MRRPTTPAVAAAAAATAPVDGRPPDELTAVASTRLFYVRVHHLILQYYYWYVKVILDINSAVARSLQLTSDNLINK